MRLSRNARAISTMLTVVLLHAAAVSGTGSEAGQSPQNPHDAHRAAEASGAASTTVGLPDVTLVNQDGQAVRFYSDVVKGKIVAIVHLSVCVGPLAGSEATACA